MYLGQFHVTLSQIIVEKKEEKIGDVTESFRPFFLLNKVYYQETCVSVCLSQLKITMTQEMSHKSLTFVNLLSKREEGT